MTPAPAAVMPPAASRRFTRTEKHGMPRRERITLVWNRAVHRMLDAPTHAGFLLQQARALRLSTLIDHAPVGDYWWNRESA